MRKTAFYIMILTIFSKILGFVRVIVLAYFYGASNISDAYLIAISIPSIIFGFVAAGLTSGYIPMYSKIQKDYGNEQANEFTNNLVNIVIVISTIVILGSMIFTKQIVKVFALGFDTITLEMATQFTKISLIAIYFIGIISIFTGYLQIKRKYIIPALVGLPLNLVNIIAIYFSSKINIFVLAAGFVIAAFSQFIFMLPYMRKNDYNYSFFLDFKSKHIYNMAYITIPVIIGVSVNQINVLIDRTIASQIVTGGISALNYANKLNLFIQGIFVMPVSTVIYPLISKLAVEKNYRILKDVLIESIINISLLVIPITIGSMLFSNQIIKFLFGRGEFDKDAILITSNALFYYSIGMIGFGLREILSRAFYSIQDTRTPMVNALIGVVANIILNIILSRYLGIGGLALATSISAIFTSTLLFISLYRKIGLFKTKQLVISLIKILAASLIMGICAICFFNKFTQYFNEMLALITTVCISGLIYFITIYFLRIEAVDSILCAFKKKVIRSNE